MARTLRYLACSLFACLALNASATVTNITTNSGSTTWTTTDESYSGTIDGISLTCEKNNGNSLGSCASAAYIQVKKGNLLTIEAGGETITKVVITCTAAAQKMSVNGTEVEPDETTVTWTGSATKVQAENLGTPMKIASIEVTHGAVDADTPAAPVIAGASTFSGSTDITITAAEGTVVFYTTDNTVPTTSSLTNNTNSVTVPLTTSTTIQAIAVKDGKVSETATATFTCFEAKTIADLNAATADQKNVSLTLTNARVVYSYYMGYYLYVREGDVAIRFDGTFYGQNYTEGSVINGTIIVNYANYNGAPAVSSNSYTDLTALTVTESSDAVEPVATTIAELKELKHVEDLISLSGVKLTSEKGTYGVTYTLTDADGNTVACPTVIDSDFAAKANDGNDYTVKAVFDSVDEAGNPQLTVITGLTTDAIQSVSADAAAGNAPVYNIAGQKVNAAYKGIVIKNGRKVIANK